MNLLLCVFYSLCFTASIQSTPAVIDCEKLSVNGLAYQSSKEQILQVFGSPLQTFEPNYDCGFLSKEEQGVVYYSMKYKFLLFTGNDAEGYLLEEALLDASSNMAISYKGNTLSHSTSIQQFERIFETAVVDDFAFLYFKGADDGLRFIFQKGKLIKIEYWSPC